MATVQDILAIKGTKVYYVAAHESVLNATRLMNDAGIGALVVTADDRVVGMFTERDVLRRVVGEEREPAACTVGEVMTERVACCYPETDLIDARSVMKHRRIRHLPVLDHEGQLQGLVSIGDLNAFDADGRETQIFLLQEYLYGRT